MRLDSWEEERLFLFVRVKEPEEKKVKEYQLNLFSPDDGNYKYSAICTNMNLKAKNLFKFMSGRSAQEKAIGELKSDFSFDKLPSGSFAANSAFLQLCMLSYNLMTSFQLEGLGYKETKQRKIITTRIFKNVRFKTIRFFVINKAGLFYRPNGKQVLALSKNEATKKLYNKILNYLDLAA